MILSLSAISSEPKRQPAPTCRASLVRAVAPTPKFDELFVYFLEQGRSSRTARTQSGPRRARKTEPCSRT